MSEDTPPDAHSLLDRITAGDDGALGQLYDAHAPVLYGLALRLTGDPGDASDLVASVFRRAWEDSMQMRSAGLSDRAWLVARCRQLAKERPRQPRLVPSPPSPSRALATGTGDGADVLPLPPSGDIVRRDRVLSALDSLTISERQVLDLVYLDGFTVDDVAQRMTLSTHAARGLVNSAMDSLRRSLQPSAVS
ncbi:MAG: sigma-70 family RNA polymerase sigma factor [Gemmatimonadaceae bacterium]